MRIARLSLTAFGPFTDREVDLDGPGVQVIYGPNGAGKSTSMRALEGLLFGIPMRTTDAWRHDMTELRVGARLLGADGTPLDVIRRKGNKNTLRDADDDAVVAEATLTALLGNADRNLYGTMFSLSQHALREGGDELLADKGDLGAALFGAGTGNAGARALLTRLEDEAAELFKAGGSKPRINAAISRHRKAAGEIAGAGVTANAWDVLEKRVRDAESALHGNGVEAGDVRRLLGRAERILRVFGPVKERAAILAELAGLADVPVLDPDATQRRKDAQRERAEADAAHERATAARDAAAATLDGLRPDPVVLEHEARIDELLKEVGRHRTGARDLIRLRGEAGTAANEAIEAMGAAGPQASLDADAPADDLSAAQTEGIRALAREHGELQATVKATERAQAEEVRTRDELRDRLEALPPAADTVALAHAAKTARAAGDLDETVRRATADLQDARAALAADARRLPHVGDDPDAVVVLPVPLGPAIDGFVEALTALDDRAKELARAEDRLATDRRATDDELRRLELAGDVPTEDDLRRARDVRDERWAGIRTAWLTDVPAADDDAVLAEAFAGDIGEADATADRLRAESQRVAQKAQLVVRGEGLELDAAQLETARAQLDADRAAHDAAWTALWDPCGMTPEAPKAMAAWATAHRELVRDAAAVAKTRAERDRAEALRDGHRAVLVGALGVGSADARDAGHDDSDDVAGLHPAGGAPPSRTLASLLDEAESRCDAADDLRRRRESLEDQVRGQARKLLECETAEATARDALAVWRAAWATAVDVLDLGPEAPTTQALAALDARDAFRTRRGKLRDLERRIAGVERDIAQFESDVEAVRVAVGEPAAADAPATITALLLRLKRARETADAVASTSKARAAATDAITSADGTRRAADEALSALRSAAGVATVDELPAAEERSATVRDLRARADDVDRRIVELGEDDLDALVAAVEDADRDALAAERDALKERDAALSDERSTIAQELGGAKKELEQVDGESRAAEHAEVAQQALAEVEEATERYVRVRLAAQLLRRAIETYREKTAGPVLRRANELFPELTNGGFTGVASDVGDRDEPVLLAVRGQERIHVEHLSDGERDALYLALRVATLEHYFQTSDPMPLILDDLMLNLDDDRSKAAFRVLGRLTEVTQVLLFTHHRHLVELAEEALGEAGVRVLELG